MPRTHPIEAALAPVMKAAGYTKRRRTWHRREPDVVCVFDAMKSQWSDSFQLNLGLYLRALGPEDRPPEYRCHVRNGLFALVPDRNRLIQLLDFEDHSVGQGRLDELVGLVVRYALPWLSAHSDEEAVGRLVAGGSVLMVDVAAREYFAGRTASAADTRSAAPNLLRGRGIS
ncbi:MAG: DUF4304 domain-containing protein [Gemmataceae bacterium]